MFQIESYFVVTYFDENKVPKLLLREIYITLCFVSRSFSTPATSSLFAEKFKVENFFIPLRRPSNSTSALR
jgi:hypothetical protein